MYLKSLHIENFRRFERFECEFHERLTLLMGVNGSGKSSLLKAASLPVSAAIQNFGWNRQNEFGVQDVRTTYASEPSSESWETVAFPSRLTLTLDLDGAECVLPLAHTPTAEVWESPGNLAQLGKAANTWFFSEHAGPIPLIARFGVRALAESKSAPSLNRPFDQKQQLWDRFNSDQMDVAMLAQWFQHHEFRALQEGAESPLFRAVKLAVMSSIHADDIKFVVRQSRLMVQHKDGTWRPFDQLSDGQKRIAALFLEIAIRAASLNSHLGDRCLLDAPGFVLIDELDMHLHPQWQRSVIDNLLETFPKLQFVVASHSPFLIQAALERGVVIDVATGQPASATDHSIEDIAEQVMGVDQPQRSQRFLEMRQLAQEYLELMESPAPTAEAKAALKARLDLALSVFADDPAAAAWLSQRRIAKGV